MPVAVIITKGAIPALLEADTEEILLHDISALAVTPDAAKASTAACRTWLESLDPPSGWFDTPEEAEAYRERVSRERDSQLIKTALRDLGMSHRELTAALGLVDSISDGSPIRKIQSGKIGLSGPTRRALAYLVKHGAMDRKEEVAILAQLGNGAWRQVDRRDIRRA